MQDKVCLVTGGASGLGVAIVTAVVEAGAKVVIADIQMDRALRLADKLGPAARVTECDVREESQIEDAINFTRTTCGGLDCMVNNAGVLGALGPITEMDTAEFDATLQVDLRSVFLGTKHAAKVMKANGTRGTIVNMGSVCSVRCGLDPVAYEVAKVGVKAITEGAACELAPDRIRVNCVAPGAVAGPMVSTLISGDPDGDSAAFLKDFTPGGEPLLPENIASTVLYLASDMSKGVTGHTVIVDNGWLLGIGGRPTPNTSLRMPMLNEAGKLGLNKDQGQFPGFAKAEYYKKPEL
ncbi:hypothetical protein WJX72_006414 [[Myrmecia] bisecta]|uniref:Uncharacterized protein n=1 Tax=[Myrmecia] bisecta TaxID=41462 RepID=A0AAW1PJY8_9CHLO